MSRLVMFRRNAGGLRRSGFTLHLSTLRARLFVLKVEADWSLIDSQIDFTLRTPRAYWYWTIPFPERRPR